jgi:class 3 adenylate cyclase
VLSSVYHSGNPIVINDIDAHLFQLNEASRDVIVKLGTQGFIMVQIPGRDGSWGVMVADQQHKKQILGQRDIKVLERLAQQLSVALDKRADYEREERLRNYFQRYVPSAVVAESLGQGRPILGGQMRPIVAMFVDIRGFTNIAASLTPTATVNFLNRFFSVLEPTISEYGGVVDKYLGDGALVTWGALGTTKPDPSKAISAAQSLLQRIELLNVAGMNSGQPRLEVGIGLHVGQAVVGNIGSENRVEFTSIGSAVNYASRLEGLCKSLGCSIVASSDIGNAHCKGWEEVRSVMIRGISEPQNVWIYRLPREGRVAQDSEERSVA